MSGLLFFCQLSTYFLVDGSLVYDISKNKNVKLCLFRRSYQVHVGKAFPYFV